MIEANNSIPRCWSLRRGTRGGVTQTAPASRSPPPTPCDANRRRPHGLRGPTLNGPNGVAPPSFRQPRGIRPRRAPYTGWASPAAASRHVSATLAGAYPFLAEGGLGSAGVFVGQDLYSGGLRLRPVGAVPARRDHRPERGLGGHRRGGQSALAKSLYTRSTPFRRRVYVPGDPKGEHTAVAEAVGGSAIVLGHGLRARLNPLDAGHRPTGPRRSEWTSPVAARRRDLIGALAETVLGRGLSPVEHTAIDLALTRPSRSPTCRCCPWWSTASSTPTPAADPRGRLAEDGRLVGHALRRLVAGDLPDSSTGHRR